jgi:hypothetical protein
MTDVRNPLPLVQFPNTVVFNAIPPGGYTDLDLTVVVGARTCIVLLSILNSTGVQAGIYFRQNGTAWLVGNSNGCFGSAPNNTTTTGHVVKAVNGIVEWYSNNVAGTITITLEAFIYA